MTATLALAGCVLLVGALVQGTVGYGMNLVAAPVMALLDPALVPIPLLVVSSVHGMLAAVREFRHADWRGVAWYLPGRLTGMALGVWIVATLPSRPFSLVVGVAVLICVALSLATWKPVPTPRTLLVAGVASGTFGTAATIGGPPIALVYQHERGPRIRATLAVTFMVGSLTSVAGLAAGGQVHGRPLLDAVWLLPFLVAGFALSGPLRRHVDAGRMRTAVLSVAAISAVALIVRAAAG